MATAAFSTPVREALATYDIQDLAFSHESPRFRAGYDWHRQELQVADEHLEHLTTGAAAVVRALQVLGAASARLASDLERTPAVFQASPVTASLAGVLQDLASAGDVLAESLDLSLRTPLDALRSDVSRVDDVKRATDRADDSAAQSEADLLRGDWRRVERDVQRGDKLRSRGEESELPKSIAAVVDARARSCAEGRRLAELRRFELARFTSSLRRRTGLVLAEAALAALCSLRAFHAQAAHAVSDATTAAHAAHTTIANACDAERAPWDYRMLKLQETLNAMPHLSQKESSFVAAHEGQPVADILPAAESAYGTYDVESRLSSLYADTNSAALEGYLWCQSVGGFGRQAGPWQRRYFLLGAAELRVSKSEPSTIAGLVQAALARELSEDELKKSNDDDTELVATLLLSSVKTCPTARCAFEVRSAHGSPLRLQARGDADRARWTGAITSAIERQLTKTPKAAPKKPPMTPEPLTLKTPSSMTPFLRRAVSSSPVPPKAGALLRSFSSPDMIDTKRHAPPPPPPHQSPTGLREAARLRRVARVEQLSTTCCDCGAKRPEWAVINRGALVCLRCSGVHRSLGTHVSKVRSLRLDRLSDSTLQFLGAVGNAKCNAVFEANLTPDAKPKPNIDAKRLQAFIRAKWAHQNYVANADGYRDSALRAAIIKSDVLAALAALAVAPDVGAARAHTEQGDAPLHLAARRGDLVVAALLVLNGDSCDLLNAVDAEGRRPHDLLAADPPEALGELLRPR